MQDQVSDQCPVDSWLIIMILCLRERDIPKICFINLSLAILYYLLFHILTMKQMIKNISGASMHEYVAIIKTIPALRNIKQGRANGTTFHLR